MKKKITVLTLYAMLFAPCVSAEAQQPKKVHRIGYLSALDPARESTRFEAIRQALRELVQSLARPGGNVTGITNIRGELDGKRLELLKEAAPKVARVAVIYDPAVPGTVLAVKEGVDAVA